MARSAVTICEMTLDAGFAATADAIDTSNGHQIAAGDAAHKILVFVDNTGTVDGTVTVKAGDNPPALRAGLGDLEIEVAGSARSFFMLESARFAQSNGDIEIDIAGCSGNIYAYQLP